jgi:hypothetical protein
MTPHRYLGQVILENYTLDILVSFILCLILWILFFVGLLSMQLGRVSPDSLYSLPEILRHPQANQVM